MRLKRVLIENFRGVRRLDLTLDQTTVLISENHHGKATVLDALGLCLGLRGSDTDSCFREGDCCAPEAGKADLVRIVLTFDDHDTEPGPGRSGLDHSGSDRSGLDHSGSDRSDSDHSASDDSDTDRSRPERREQSDSDDDPAGLRRGPVRLEFSGSPPDRHIHRRFIDEEGLPLDPQPDHSEMERIQRAHPVLMLRFARPRHDGPSVGASDDKGFPDSAVTGNRRGPGDLAATIARVYQELALQSGPISEDHVNRGLAAAHRLLEETESDAAPEAPVRKMLGELRAEVRRWGRPPAADASLNLSGSGSHNLALLLVLGSILAVRGETSLDEEAWPIIAIEDPEAHLHPILLASTRRVIEALRAQTIVTTNSGELISSARLSQLRRLVPSEREIDVYRLRKGSLTAKDMRRVAYHIRAKRGSVLFARCWMLVEGESEFWLMNQLADVLGYDLDAEGVRLIEFAQCGVAPLAKLANDLGIPWHLLADGDDSGSIYARHATDFLGGATAERRISKLGHRDVEHTLWHSGFEDVYRAAARLADRPDGRDPPPGRIIAKAVRKRSKPYLALAVAEAAAERGRRSIPRVLRRAIESSVSLAREAAGKPL